MNQTILDKLPPQTNGQWLRQQTVVLEDQTVHVPGWVVDHASFRLWSDTDEFPEKSPRICYLAGEVWIDMSGEQIFTHNRVKTELTRVLANLVKKSKQGPYFSDGVMITNLDVELSCKPDGVFVSEESFDRDRVRLVTGAKEGYVKLEGTPDMVLEVVSDSSVEKDTVTLRDLYHHAGIREYWLVDVRADLHFDILRRSRKGYTATAAQKGWLKSPVFGKSFRLTEGTDNRGNPEYTLRVR